MTEHEPNETDQVKMILATEETDFYVGCHFTMMDSDEDDEPQPAAHQAYMMEQDEEIDMEDYDYWWNQNTTPWLPGQ